MIKSKNDVCFQIGDEVYIDNGSKLNRTKLDKIRIGPFPIVKQLSNNVFEIKVGQGPQSNRLYHASKLIRKL